MALDYEKCAREIFENVGGRENIVSAAHCATRLRLVTVDNSKVDRSVLENIEGGKGRIRKQRAAAADHRNRYRE